MGGLDPLFRCMSADSAAPMTIDYFLIVEELQRELDLRRASYPGRVERRKMTQAEADRQINIIAAIHADFSADLLARQKIVAAFVEKRAAADLRLERFKWAELISVLRREIDLRRKYYPHRVEEQQLAPIKARQQLERIEAAHFHYWFMGRRFWPEELDHKRYQSLRLTEAERQIYRDAYAAHRARFLDIDEDPRGGYAPDDDDDATADTRGSGWAA